MNHAGTAQDWLNEWDVSSLTNDLQALIDERLRSGAIIRPSIAESPVRELFRRYNEIRVKADLVFGAQIPIIGFVIRIVARIIFMGKVWEAQQRLLHALVDEVDPI